ncbi:MAG: hypothetical protein WC575_02375 [Patescibacteria group bacterium]
MAEHFNQPTEFEPGSPEDIADKLVTKWEASAVFDDQTDNEMKGIENDNKSLGRSILDCLEQERPRRNEKEMLELIRAMTDGLNKIIIRGDKVRAEVDEALKRLNEQFDQYKSIEQI